MLNALRYANGSLSKVSLGKLLPLRLVSEGQLQLWRHLCERSLWPGEDNEAP